GGEPPLWPAARWRRGDSFHARRRDRRRGGGRPRPAYAGIGGCARSWALSPWLAGGEPPVMRAVNSLPRARWGRTLANVDSRPAVLPWIGMGRSHSARPAMMNKPLR